MVMEYYSLILAVIIGIIYFFSNRYSIKHKDWNKKIVSFSAGVAITYVLLELFPTFTEGALIIDKLIFLALPIGFIAHHIIEKEIYKHNHRHELIRMLSLEEQTFSFVYHLIIGIVLVTFTTFGLIEGLLFFIPMATYTFLSTLPTEAHPSRLKAIFLSGATLFGAIIGLLLTNVMPRWLDYSLMGLALGVLLFTVIRHHVPFGRKGKIGYFTTGFLIYSLIIIASWYI
jgi:hypothetical protein